MPNELSPPSSTRIGDEGPSDRLDSWKDIAAYLKRDVSTVQRWEKRERMPVHRHVHDRLGTVYGSVLGSFAVERFGLDRLRTLTRREIQARARHFLKLTQFTL